MRKRFHEYNEEPCRLSITMSVHLVLAAALAALAAAAAEGETPPAPAPVLPESSGAGTAVMWGATFEHDPLSLAPAVSSVPIPVPMGPGLAASSVTQVAAGIYHACMLFSDGSVACLGSNAEGQLCLGQGSPRWTGTPLAVPGGPYTQVTAGTYFTCLLLAGGSARCCGSNPHGELGDGSRRASPAAVPSAPALKLAQISAGATHVCGIEEATSRAFCWGSNASWQLGGGAQANASAAVQAGRLSTSPVAAAGGLEFAEVSAGAELTCGRAVEGGTYCWGNNQWGSLGNRTFQPVASVAPLLVAGGHSFGAISCGHKHCCGIDEAMTAWCWGLNTFGALGSQVAPATAVNSSAFFWDSRYNSAMPLEVRAANGSSLRFKQISAGFAFTCGVSAEGRGLCWGDNQQGQGGNAGSGMFAPPTPVFGDPALLALSTSVSEPQTAVSTYAILQPAAAAAPAAAAPAGSEAAVPPAAAPQAGAVASSHTAAIVGGVMGGLAAAALAAGLAAVPARRWLRRRRRRHAGHLKIVQVRPLTPEAPAPDVSLLPRAGPHALASLGALPVSYLTEAEGSGEGSLLHGAAAAAPQGPTGSALTVVTVSAASSSSATAAHASGSAPASRASVPRQGSNSGDEDPLLSHVAAYLARTRRQQAGQHAPSGPRSSGSGLSGGVRQWECGWEEVAVLQRTPLGRGSFGKVFLARWRETEVAVKILTQTDLGGEEGLELSARTLRKLEEEAAVMARLRHPHVVSLLGICTVPPCIITEYCRNGSLYGLLRQAREQPEVAAKLSWPVRLRMMLDAATGLLYLHSCSPPIVHRDYKSPNLLVDEHWRVKVSDFNLSKVLETQLQELGVESSLAALNPMWQAPEVLAEGADVAQPASDVFSFGLVMLEVLTWRLPWEGLTPFQVAHRVLNGARPEVPPPSTLPGIGTAASWHGLHEYCQLMRECWAQDPAARPPLSQVVPRLRALLEGAAAASPGGSPP